MQILLSIRLPWWWRIYLGAVTVAHNIGVIEADPEIAAAFITRHARLITKKV